MAASRRRILHKAKKHIEAGTELKKLDIETLHEFCLTSSDPRFVNLGHMMTDNNFRDHGMVGLCARAGIGIKDVANFYQEIQVAQGKLQQARHAPAIMETNARAAIGKQVPCPTCRGRKTIFERCINCEGDGRLEYKDDEGKKGHRDCPSCMGAGLIDMGPCLTCAETGWVAEAGDKNAVDTFMESTGQTGRTGPLVNLTQNFSGTGDGSFEELMRMAEKKPPANVIEGKAEDVP